ncbi:hypothetical protein LIA77_00191 [Sarocladium implicatum]|nr:hypothetical protein LIA77_00191 [Sarocladium implicatum]
MTLLPDHAMDLLVPASVYATQAIYPPIHLTICLPKEYGHENQEGGSGTYWPYYNLHARVVVKPVDGVRTRGMLTGETEVTGQMTLLPDDTEAVRSNMYVFIWKHGSEEDGPRFVQRADNNRWQLRVDIFHEGEKIGECETGWIWVLRERSQPGT